MKLFRFATVFLKAKPPTQEPLSFQGGNISVDMQELTSPDGKEHRLLLRAAIGLDTFPDVSPKGEVTVPEQPRKATEAAIESLANVLAVLNHSPRRISSPTPFIALGLENEEEKHWATSLSHFLGERSGIPWTFYRLPTTPEHLAALSDRMDGVALLAEAITHEHPTGKFHEFMRLFERAFALSPSQFDKKLAQFLQGTNFCYERKEINKWVELRNPATHANDSTRKYIVLESDVRPVITRMEQAAFDVLWNKKSWHNPSKERRRVWHPTVGTTSARHDLMVTQGSDASFIIQALDPFQAFYLDAGLHIPVSLPDFWASWPTSTPPLVSPVQPEDGDRR